MMKSYRKLVVLGCVILIILPLLWLGQQYFQMFFGKPEQPVRTDKGVLSIGTTTGIQTISDYHEIDSYQFTATHFMRVKIRVETTSDINFTVAVYPRDDTHDIGSSHNIGRAGPVELSVGLAGGDYVILVIPDDLGSYQLWLECGDPSGCN